MAHSRTWNSQSVVPTPTPAATFGTLPRNVSCFLTVLCLFVYLLPINHRSKLTTRVVYISCYHLIYLALTRQANISPALNKPRARYQITRVRPYAPQTPRIIKMIDQRRGPISRSWASFLTFLNLGSSSTKQH